MAGEKPADQARSLHFRLAGNRVGPKSAQPSGGGPRPVHRNEPRPTAGLLRMNYLTLPLLAAAFSAAAVAEGSAKAITASPSSKLVPGFPPEP